jgi:SAM-dependent methyltransferase
MKMSSLKQAIVGQFRRPTGVGGVLAGLVMAGRASNRERNRRTIELLGIGPRDRVLEIGFGPGLAVAAAAAAAVHGSVVGIDHSAVMLGAARRRNRKAIAEGRVDLRLGPVLDLLPGLAGRFDKALAVNVYMFFPDGPALLRAVREVLVPGGRVAITFQPRGADASDEKARVGGERIAREMTAAGFTAVTIKRMPMRPVAAVCVLGTR